MRSLALARLRAAAGAANKVDPATAADPCRNVRRFVPGMLFSLAVWGRAVVRLAYPAGTLLASKSDASFDGHGGTAGTRTKKTATS
jgi:hypothetical protein